MPVLYWLAGRFQLSVYLFDEHLACFIESPANADVPAASHLRNQNANFRQHGRLMLLFESFKGSFQERLHADQLRVLIIGRTKLRVTAFEL